MESCFEINSTDELVPVAIDLIAKTEKNKVVAFYGSMGSGKTTFIKTICKQMGVKEGISSPTFSIINEYALPNQQRIFHFDFYRIKSLAEAYDLGYEDYFYSNNYCFIEWPEMIETLLPTEIVRVKISVNNGIRKICY
jgi:tRNA threonylcarbamoyladenosine biosynthesis protein TsaE